MKKGEVLKEHEGGVVGPAVDEGRHVARSQIAHEFEIDEEKEIELQRIDAALERKQVERLKALRAKRDAAKWQQSIEGIQNAARHGENLMPRIITAVEANATVGEIADTMRVTFGEYRETVVL